MSKRREVFKGRSRNRIPSLCAMYAPYAYLKNFWCCIRRATAEGPAEYSFTALIPTPATEPKVGQLH